MKVIELIILSIFICTIASCGPKKLTPATVIIYEGALAGDGDVTYPSAQKVVEKCVQAKICMGLGGFDYPLPEIRGMSGGNAVKCGDSLKEGCYSADGFITVVQGGDADIISHECVHHWLYQNTGDLDPLHESEYFLSCGGALSITEDSN
jgi:hypothetical protein